MASDNLLTPLEQRILRERKIRKRRAYRRAYYREHREAILTYNRAHYTPEKRRAAKRAWIAKHGADAYAQMARWARAYYNRKKQRATGDGSDALGAQEC